MASEKKVTNNRCAACGTTTRTTDITSLAQTKSGKVFPDTTRFTTVHHCTGGELKK